MHPEWTWAQQDSGSKDIDLKRIKHVFCTSVISCLAVHYFFSFCLSFCMHVKFAVNFLFCSCDLQWTLSSVYKCDEQLPSKGYQQLPHTCCSILSYLRLTFTETMSHHMSYNVLPYHNWFFLLYFFFLKGYISIMYFSHLIAYFYFIFYSISLYLFIYNKFFPF